MNRIALHCLACSAILLVMAYSSFGQQPYWQQAPAPPAGTIVGVNSNGYIFARTGSQALAEGAGLFRSADNRKSWANIGFVNQTFGLFAFPPNVGVFIVADKLLHGSTDTGNTWSQAGLIGVAVSSMVTNSIGYIFVGSYDGIFRSADYGASWTTLDAGLTTGSIDYLFEDKAGYVYAATGINGLFRSVLPTTPVKKMSNNIPTAFSLSQNYPNPFNPSTVISYELSANSYVTLKVYDVLGRLVKTLVDERQNAGRYSVTFNGGGLASGVYFLRMNSVTFSETKKMLLEK